MSEAAHPVPATPMGEPLADYVRPRGFTVVEGEPRCRNWRHYLREEDGMMVSAGIWEATKGAFAFRFEHWEFLHVIFGAVRITPTNGESMTLRAGEALVIEPGFEGRWEVLSPMLKHYVSRAPV